MAAQHEQIFANDEEESATEKFKRKAIESPFMIGGIVGLVGACAHGAYSFKNRGRVSTSIFLMQLRITAQGAVIGSLMCGAILQLGTRLYNKMQEKPQ